VAERPKADCGGNLMDRSCALNDARPILVSNETPRPAKWLGATTLFGSSSGTIKTGLGLLTLEESFYLPVFSGNAAEATYQAELALKDQSLESCLDRVALAGLKLGERDQERGILGREQSECITVMVKEMLDNLADFEPRRWFSNLGPKVERAGGPPGDLASLSTTENGEDSEALIERNELAPGWVVDEPILSIGGRSMLDEAAVAIFAEVLKKRGLGAHVFHLKRSQPPISPRLPAPKQSSYASLILA
jgi:hypothetical protein